MKFLTTVLTSGNIKQLRKSLFTIPGHYDTHIICNTLDDSFREELDNSELGERYPIIHTESNGLAGAGHQSCLDHFLTTDYTHLIKLDGDDRFTEDGHQVIVDKMTANPDVNVLSLLGCQLLTFGDLIEQNIVRSHWDNVDLRLHVERKGFDLTVDLACWMFELSGYTGDANYWFERLVCVDKKGAAIEKYNSLKCNTEDVQLMMKMKLASHRGDIVYRQFENRECYMYNKADGYSSSDSLFGDPLAWREEMLEPFTVEELKLINEIRIWKV